MTDTLPWIIAGACALWGAVATVFAIWYQGDAEMYKKWDKETERIAERALDTLQAARKERDQLRARIEAARKALEEET